MQDTNISSTYQKSSPTVLWTPHPKQKQVLERPEYEILFGGARGGGKTDAGIVWLLHKSKHPKLRALIIRRNADDLRDWTDRANQIYSKLGAVRAGNPPEFKWPKGGIFRTGHLKDEQAYTKYQGHEYQRMLIEELTQIPSEESYLRLLASCRSTVKELRPQIFITTNPGNVGHSWVKERFIDPVAPGETYKDPISGRSRVFIKSLIDDNPTLMDNDPDYVKSLEALKGKNPELYKAWRWGSWDIFAGQVFQEFRRDKHVIKQILPRQDMPHYLSFDWGYRAPHAVYAHALVKMKSEDGIVFNRIVTYQEWYDTEKHPHELAELVYKTAKRRKFKKAYADPSMFNIKTDGTMSISMELMKKWRELNKRHWLTIDRGSKNRIQRVATVHDWLSIAPDGLPYWLITNNCLNLIRTLPLLVYDEHKTEDVDTNQDDHSYDSVGYFLSSVKFISVVGSFGTKDRIARFRRFKPMKTLKKVIDLDSFAKAKKSDKDWRSI